MPSGLLHCPCLCSVRHAAAAAAHPAGVHPGGRRQRRPGGTAHPPQERHTRRHPQRQNQCCADSLPVKHCQLPARPDPAGRELLVCVFVCHIVCLHVRACASNTQHAGTTRLWQKLAAWATVWRGWLACELTRLCVPLSVWCVTGHGHGDILPAQPVQHGQRLPALCQRRPGSTVSLV